MPEDPEYWALASNVHAAATECLGLRRENADLIKDRDHWEQQCRAVANDLNDQLAAAKEGQEELLKQIDAAWAALGVDPQDAADDPDTAELADSIRVSLQHERIRRRLAVAELASLAAERKAREEAEAAQAVVLDELQRLNDQLAAAKAAQKKAELERDAATEWIDQVENLMDERDTARRDNDQLRARVRELEKHFENCGECHECALESGIALGDAALHPPAPAQASEATCKRCGGPLSCVTHGNHLTSHVSMECPKGCGMLAHVDLGAAPSSEKESK